MSIEFKYLPISRSVLRALENMGYFKSTTIQSEAIPAILDGRDVVGISHTGTGKTLAFSIPAVQIIDKDKALYPQVLILCPTRELAVQVYSEIKKLYAFDNFIKAAAIYGGDNMARQITDLKKGANIVVGTPGRVQDHINRKTLKLEHIKMFVLDEADEMLNMGFRQDIELILTSVPEKKQTLLFSATMPDAIKDIINNYLTDPLFINVQNQTDVLDLISQSYYDVEKGMKKEALLLLINYYNPARAIVFCNTKIMVDELADLLVKNKISAVGLHGDMSQNVRNAAMNGFKSSAYKILIATDVAARGIDISDIDIIFNFDLPQNSEYYLHRIGRTARAGKTGMAVSIISSDFQLRDLFSIKKDIKSDIKKLMLPKPADIKDKMMNGFLEELKLHINKSGHEKYLNYVKKLNDEGYPSEIIASALIDKSFGINDIYLPRAENRIAQKSAKPTKNQINNNNAGRQLKKKRKKIK